ncbi:MAG TPA: HD domain-containing phosphohydrolase [Longimicrobiales bacterium]|nr:HD domain-containing phosphohydrolase [Longimicrobiales bacterium]
MVHEFPRDPIDSRGSSGEPVLVLTDDEVLLGGIRPYLEQAGYDLNVFSDPSAALAEVRARRPEVIVKDHDLSAMSSLDFIHRALDEDPLVKIILVVRKGDESSAELALREDAFDYLTRPLTAGEFTRAVRRGFMTYTREEAAHRSEAMLRQEAANRSQVIKRLTVGTLTALLKAQEARTPLFRGHSQAVAKCAAGVARALDLSADLVSSIRTAGLLHDVGMIAVPDSVVNKPDQLDEAEFAAIAAHPRIGAEILEPMDHLGEVPRFVREHHERIDGSGYPDGKKGDEISLGGQVVALAEYWTAITEDRPFRDRMSSSEAMNTLAGTGGTWFDPEVLRALRKWKTRS